MQGGGGGPGACSPENVLKKIVQSIWCILGPILAFKVLLFFFFFFFFFGGGGGVFVLFF